MDCALGFDTHLFLKDVKYFIECHKEYFTVGSSASESKILNDPVMEHKSSISNKADKLKFMKDSVVNECARCKLSETRKNVVFGEGNPSSILMFIGEAPGADEDSTGRPFVGRAGKLLTKIIESINLKRDDVYIANIIKCRPPENRNPIEEEIKQCAPFLKEQIQIISPKIICTLGKFSTEFIIGTDKGTISAVRGKEFDYNGILVIPTYHPSYLMRNTNAKRETWEDMKKIRDLYSKIIS